VPDIDVAIIDTGIDILHPDLNVYKAINFVNDSLSANDDVGHGTHIAGIIGAKKNLQGIVGIVPGAKLWALKVCDYRGVCNMADVLDAIQYVTQHKDEIDVVNLSVGFANSELLNSAINASVQQGVTYVVAAGNKGFDSNSSTPANNPNVITVSAIGDSDGRCGGEGPILEDNLLDDTFANFSNYGSDIDIAAPGVQIFSTYTQEGYAVDTGTSMAAPHVTGLAAKIKLDNPDATPQEVKKIILSSSIEPGKICGNDNKGYFKGDKDAYQEPLLYLSSFLAPKIEIPPANASIQNESPSMNSTNSISEKSVQKNVTKIAGKNIKLDINSTTPAIVDPYKVIVDPYKLIVDPSKLDINSTKPVIADSIQNSTTKNRQ
ncbi:MAG TPA: S8 family serine peptidase, partial [Nitrososphaeraceae archaeon]|nr:S8 family serine peptidase [Nitrososphaeraceae archaeon]